MSIRADSSSAPSEFDVLYADQWLLALNKPSGLLSVPGRGLDKQDCLSARVQRAFPEAVVVHRLDRDTSGVMLMARDRDVQRELGRQFEQRTVEKKYTAIVYGEMAADSGCVELPLTKDFDRPPRHRVDWNVGRYARTRWRLVERNGTFSRVRLFPETGRSHQLRIHMREIGFPIVGDPLYAPPEIYRLANRMMLHAQSLSITHPVRRERITLTAACPF